MIEAMANGTPVIGFRRGSVAEIIDDDVTGYVVDNTDAAVTALPRALKLDRRAIRRRFEKRFSVARMVRDYVALYQGALQRRSVDAFVLPYDASTEAGRGLSADTSGNSQFLLTRFSAW